MNKKIVWLLSLVLVLAMALAVPALAAGEVYVVNEGVPTLVVPEGGIPLVDAAGEVLDTIDYEDIILTGRENFDEVEEQTYQELLDSEVLPFHNYFQKIGVDDGEIMIETGDPSTIFDYELIGDTKEIIATDDKAAVLLQFEVDKDLGTNDFLIAQYIDGQWYVLDPEYYVVQGGMLDITPDHEGMLAFFRFSREEDPNEPHGPDDPPIRPSVSFKAVPQLVQPEPGYLYVLKSVSVSYNDPKAKIHSDDVKLLPAKELQGKDREAYDQIANANSLADVCDNINEVLQKVSPGSDPDDLVVRDLFGVKLMPAAEEILAEDEESCMLLCFKYNIAADDTLLVLQCIDDEWVALDPSCFSVEDGYVFVKLRDTSLIAFAVE